jgi:hypothetical protein
MGAISSLEGSMIRNMITIIGLACNGGANAVNQQVQ